MVASGLSATELPEEKRSRLQQIFSEQLSVLTTLSASYKELSADLAASLSLLSASEQRVHALENSLGEALVKAEGLQGNLEARAKAYNELQAQLESSAAALNDSESLHKKGLQSLRYSRLLLAAGAFLAGLVAGVVLG